MASAREGAVNCGAHRAKGRNFTEKVEVFTVYVEARTQDVRLAVSVLVPIGNSALSLHSDEHLKFTLDFGFEESSNSHRQSKTFPLLPRQLSTQISALFCYAIHIQSDHHRPISTRFSTPQCVAHDGQLKSLLHPETTVQVPICRGKIKNLAYTGCPHPWFRSRGDPWISRMCSIGESLDALAWASALTWRPSPAFLSSIDAHSHYTHTNVKVAYPEHLYMISLPT